MSYNSTVCLCIVTAFLPFANQLFVVCPYSIHLHPSLGIFLTSDLYLSTLFLGDS